jgi:hypothetical protein
MEFSQLADKSCIVDGEKPAQLVIEMTEDELVGSCLEEGMKQGHRIAAPRDSEQIATAGREARIERQRHLLRVPA